MKHTSTRQAAHPTASSQTLKPIAPTMSDATMSITDSNNNANVEIRFKDLFPTSLEALQFDITDTSMPYITAVVVLPSRFMIL